MNLDYLTICKELGVEVGREHELINEIDTLDDLIEVETDVDKLEELKQKRKLLQAELEKEREK